MHDTRQSTQAKVGRDGWSTVSLTVVICHVTPQEKESECPVATDHLNQGRTAIQIKTISILLLFHKVRVSERSNGQRTTCLPRIRPWRPPPPAPLAGQSA